MLLLGFANKDIIAELHYVSVNEYLTVSQILNVTFSQTIGD